MGIGISSPSYKLDVAGVVRGTGNIIAGDGSAFVFGTGVTSYVSGSSTSNVIDFYTSSIARMRLDPSGQVGIGTASPGYKLDVQGATASTQLKSTTGTNYVAHFLNNTGGFTYLGVESSAGGSLFTGTAAYEAVFGTVSAYPVGFATGGAERMRIESSGNVLVTSAAGLGYGTGSGGTVTQATSKSTAVTLNKPTGQITMNAAALGAGSSVEFSVNNSLLSVNDCINLSGVWGVSPNYRIELKGVFGGGFAVRVTNITAGSLSEALVLNFALIKGATS